MIPTFFGISLVIFVVLNFAPGRPGGTQQSVDLAASVRGDQSQESYRIFREQFSLDKPKLFNLRFALKREKVWNALRVVTGTVDATAREKIEAHNLMEDYGQYAVPHLISIMRQAANAEERDIAVYFLRLNARMPQYKPFQKNPSEKTRARQKEIDQENAIVREMRYALEDSEEMKTAIIGQWEEWFEARESRWEYSTARKIRMFFFETRFAAYWSNLLRLDFGVSLVTREPVMRTLLSKLKYSISLSITSILLAYIIAIPIGIYSAVRKDSATDRAITVVLFMMYSLPSFFVATLLLYYFSKGADNPLMRWFPTGGWRSQDFMGLAALDQIKDLAWHLCLPVLCMTYASLAALSRYMRTGLLDVIQSDYVRTARAKGLRERVVIMKHAVRNGLLPILTLLAGLLPALLGGSVIIEYIFSIPGMGLWMIESIFPRDYNVIMGVSLISAMLVLIGVLLVDLSYALVDPRISFK
jgi:peptide/nickel transport system permease protein